MPKQRSTVACQHSQIRRRGNQTQLADFFVKGVIVFKYGNVAPGGDYTLIIEEIARHYGVPVEDVTVEVTSGSAIVTYILTSSPKGRVADQSVMASAIAQIILDNPDALGITCTGNDTYATYTITYQNGISTNLQPVVFPCLTFYDIFDTSGKLKSSSFTLNSGCQITFLTSVVIEEGKTLTINDNSTIDTGYYSILNYGTINNRGTINVKNQLENHSTINNTGIFNTTSQFFNTGKFYNNTGGIINNSGGIFNTGYECQFFNNSIFDNTSGNFTNNQKANFFNNNTFKNIGGAINNSSRFENNFNIDNSNGNIFNSNTGIIINTSSISTSTGTFDNNGTIYNDGGSIVTRVGKTIGPVLPISPTMFSDVFDFNGKLKVNYTLPSGFGLTLTQAVYIDLGKTLTLSKNSFIRIKDFSININGVITSQGIIYNDYGTIRNNNLLNNFNVLYNYSIIRNNYGTFTSSLLIENYGQIINSGNSGSIVNIGDLWPNPIIYQNCPIYSELSVLKDLASSVKNFVISAECELVLMGNITIETGKTLTLLENSKLFTNGFMITNKGTINNVKGNLYNDNLGIIINNGIITNGGTIMNNLRSSFTNSGTITGNPVTYICQRFIDIFNVDGTLKESNITISSGCRLELTQSILIESGKVLTLMPDSEINTNGFTITNNGAIMNGGILTITGGTGGITNIVNNGRITNTNIINNFEGLFTNNAGGSIDNSKTINLYSGISNSGNITNNQTGIINSVFNAVSYKGTYIKNESSGVISNDGTINLVEFTTFDNSGIILNKTGTFNNAGTLNNNIVNTGAMIINSKTFINNGIIINNTLTNYTYNFFGLILNDNIGTFTNKNLITNNKNGRIINFTTFANNTGAIIDNNGNFTNISGTVNNLGTIRQNALINIAKLNSCSAFTDIFDSNGNLKQDHAVNPGCNLTLLQPITIGFGKTLTLLPGSTLTTNGNRITNNGIIDIRSGATVNTDGVYRLDNQEAFAQNGELSHGVEGRIGFTGLEITLKDKKISTLKAHIYANAKGTGTMANSPTVNLSDAKIQITYDSIDNTGKTRTITGDLSMIFDYNLLNANRFLDLGIDDSTFYSIHLIARARNFYISDKADAEGTYTYRVGPYGIVGP